MILTKCMPVLTFAIIVVSIIVKTNADFYKCKAEITRNGQIPFKATGNVIFTKMYNNFNKNTRLFSLYDNLADYINEIINKTINLYQVGSIHGPYIWCLENIQTFDDYKTISDVQKYQICTELLNATNFEANSSTSEALKIACRNMKEDDQMDDLTKNYFNFLRNEFLKVYKEELHNLPSPSEYCSKKYGGGGNDDEASSSRPQQDDNPELDLKLSI